MLLGCYSATKVFLVYSKALPTWSVFQVLFGRRTPERARNHIRRASLGVFSAPRMRNVANRTSLSLLAPLTTHSLSSSRIHPTVAPGTRLENNSMESRDDNANHVYAMLSSGHNG